MDLENKVTNLELSKKLRELGIEQKSLFYWEYYSSGVYVINYYTEIEHIKSVPEHFEVQFYSAFTSDELMDLLPCYVDTNKIEPYNYFGLQVHKRSATNIQYIVKYICDTQGTDRYGNMSDISLNKNIYDENLANALAKMLICLHEEKLYVKRAAVNLNELLKEKK